MTDPTNTPLTAPAIADGQLYRLVSEQTTYRVTDVADHITLIGVVDPTDLAICERGRFEAGIADGTWQLVQEVL